MIESLIDICCEILGWMVAIYIAISILAWLV